MSKKKQARSFKELVRWDLERAQRLIRRIDGQELDPQFRIATPEGDVWIGITLTNNMSEREKRMALVKDYMAYRLSPAFTMASEIEQPDALLCIGVQINAAMKEGFTAHGAACFIVRKPLSFSPMEWLTREQIGNDLPSMLPMGETQLSQSRINELIEWFGPGGKFEALQIGIT